MRAYHSAQAAAVKARAKMAKADHKGQGHSSKGEKLREKSATAEAKAIGARNEYLLSLAMANE